MIQIGQKVFCGLNGGQNGVVYAIHGEQRPDTVHSVAGVVLCGGTAVFDIVFDNGYEDKMLPEAVLYGVQWKIRDEIVDSARIESMRAFAASEKARKEAEARKAEELFAAEVEKLRANPAYAALTQTTPDATVSRGKLAATNIRRQLKVVFPRTKFSVRMESYNSVRVAWRDGPSVKAVQAITGEYSGGYFDGMDDSYHYADSPWTRVFGSAQYIFETRTHSVAAMTRAVEAVCRMYGWPMIDVKASSYDGSAYLGNCEQHQSRAVMMFLEDGAQ